MGSTEGASRSAPPPRAEKDNAVNAASSLHINRRLSPPMNTFTLLVGPSNQSRATWLLRVALSVVVSASAALVGSRALASSLVGLALGLQLALSLLGNQSQWHELAALAFTPFSASLAPVFLLARQGTTRLILPVFIAVNLASPTIGVLATSLACLIFAWYLHSYEQGHWRSASLVALALAVLRSVPFFLFDVPPGCSPPSSSHFIYFGIPSISLRALPISLTFKLAP